MEKYKSDASVSVSDSNWLKKVLLVDNGTEVSPIKSENNTILKKKQLPTELG